MNTALEDTARMFMWQRWGVRQNSKARQSFANEYFGKAPHELEPDEIDYQKAREHLYQAIEPKTNWIVYDDCVVEDIPKLTKEIPDVKYQYVFSPPVTPITSFDIGNLQFAKQFLNYTNAQQKETTTMCGYAMNTNEDTTLRYIKERLWAINVQKSKELDLHFQIHGIYPKNVKEMQKWLKEGNFHINKDFLNNVDDDEDEDDEYYNSFRDNWVYAFKWGKQAPDMKAYKKADQARTEAYQSAVDKVAIITDEKTRLEVLEEFKSKTFH